MIFAFSLFFTSCNFDSSNTDKDSSDKKMITENDVTNDNPVTNENSVTPINASDPVLTAGQTMLISPDGSAVTFTCKAESTDGAISYQWYQSSDSTKENITAIEGATLDTYTTEAFAKREIRYYFCTVTNTIPGNGASGNKTSSLTTAFYAAYTGLPAVYIITPDKTEIVSKEAWLENASITLISKDNPDWNFENLATSIRGRGNTTWFCPKKPYALKLNGKTKVMGMPKHKRWVLIANYLDNSFIRNSMAFYLSEKFEMDYTVRGKFVDLILNGEYKGLYWFCEAIKEDSNRVNIDKDNDYLIEMDVYYDENWKFISAIRQMPYMIKNDDAMTATKLVSLNDSINELELLLYPDYDASKSVSDCKEPDTSYSSKLDITSWAKFWLINEIMNNVELGHPKSCYFTFKASDGILRAGPVWDFDWASLGQATSCNLTNTIYYNALFKSYEYKNKLKEIWNEKSAEIKISETMEELRLEIAISAELDEILWGVNHNPLDFVYDDFNGHIDFLKETLEKKMQIVENFINNL